MSWYQWYPAVLRKYAVFSGRARRKEFWFFVLCNALIVIGLTIVDSVIGLSENPSQGILVSLYWLAVLIPSIAVGVRRLHDTGRSGWWILLGLVPIIGLVLIVFYVIGGQRGPNKYGPDPKGEGATPEAPEAGYAPPEAGYEPRSDSPYRDVPPAPVPPAQPGGATGGSPDEQQVAPPPPTALSPPPPAMPSPAPPPLPPDAGQKEPGQ
jgi:uncharacterized membrane protein YhaH (DUF805 family)